MKHEANKTLLVDKARPVQLAHGVIVNARSALETLLLGAAFLFLGWLLRGFRDERDASKDALTATKTMHAEAIASTAKTAATVARIEARAGEISKGMAINAKAIDDLARCELEPELIRLFQLRRETINTAIDSAGVQAGARN